MIHLKIRKTDIKKNTHLTGYKLYAHQRRKKNIIKLAKRILPAGCTILDVGCSVGDIAIELASLGYTLHGIDLDVDRLEKARNLAAKYGAHIEFENKRLEDFNGPQKYDAVLLGETLEHFSNPAEMLVKIEQALNVNARVIITTPNMPSFRNRLKFGLMGIFPDNFPEHKYYFDFRRFKDIISKTNFEIERLDSKFTNIECKSAVMARLEDIFLFWFTWLFPKSGDTIFAVLSLVNYSANLHHK